MARKIYALKFELEADTGIVELIAWIDQHGQSKYLEATHPDKTLMDMRAGDVVTFKRKQTMTVKRLKPWRTNECKDDTQYSEVESGAAWEAECGPSQEFEPLV